MNPLFLFGFSIVLSEVVIKINSSAIFFFNLIEISDGHIIFADVKTAYYTYRHKDFGTPSPLISILRRAERRRPLSQ